MPGEAPDYSSIDTAVGVPLLNPTALGQLNPFRPIILATDISGYDGFMLHCTPSNQGNVRFEVSWYELVNGSNVFITTDYWSVPSTSKVIINNEAISKWFPAKGNRVTVNARGSVGATYDGTATIVPRVKAPGTGPLGMWVPEAATLGQAPGLLAGIGTAVGAGATATVLLNTQAYGPVSMTWANTLPAGTIAGVDSFDYTDLLVCSSHFAVSGNQSSPLNWNLPATCYHKMLLFNPSGGPVTPDLFLVADMTKS